MFPGLDFEFCAREEMHYRQTVLYPALAQRAQQQRVLNQPSWPEAARWHLGTAFVRLGERLRTPAARQMASNL